MGQQIMGGLFGIYSCPSCHLPHQRILFSPVPGLFFNQQPVCCYPCNGDHVFGDPLFIAAPGTDGVKINSFRTRKNNPANE